MFVVATVCTWKKKGRKGEERGDKIGQRPKNMVFGGLLFVGLAMLFDPFFDLWGTCSSSSSNSVHLVGHSSYISHHPGPTVCYARQPNFYKVRAHITMVHAWHASIQQSSSSLPNRERILSKKFGIPSSRMPIFPHCVPDPTVPKPVDY